MEQSYKEKYEQAIEKLRNFCRDYDIVSCLIDVKEELANLFPELAESEQKPNGGIVREDFTQGDGWYKVNLDYLSKVQVEEIEQLVEKWNPKEVSEEEKIKKAILIYLDWLDGKKDYLPKGDYTIKDMILWLERQGEHANFLSKIQVGDKVTRNEYGVLVNLSQLKRVAKPSEKQGEQIDIANKEYWRGYREGKKEIFDKYAEQSEKKPADKVEPKFKVGEKELTDEELCEGLIRGMVNEHNRVTKEVLRTEYEKGRADVLAKIDAIDVDEMVYESGATSRVTQYWYAHGVNDVIKKLKEEQV